VDFAFSAVNRRAWKVKLGHDVGEKGLGDLECMFFLFHYAQNRDAAEERFIKTL
jgi:hypothetical protein